LHALRYGEQDTVEVLLYDLTAIEINAELFSPRTWGCSRMISDLGALFIIDKKYAANLLNKVTVYRKHTGTKKQIFIAMISANNLKPSIYSEEMISNVVTLDDFFKD